MQTNNIAEESGSEAISGHNHQTESSGQRMDKLFQDRRDEESHERVWGMAKAQGAGHNTQTMEESKYHHKESKHPEPYSKVSIYR